MPVLYERDDDRRRILVTVIGAVGLEEFIGLLERQAREGMWRYGVLYNADGLEPPPAAEVRTMVIHLERLIAQHGPRGPVAIVSKTAAIYGTPRMYSTLTERLHLDVAVFRTAGEADRWLTAQASAVS